MTSNKLIPENLRKLIAGSVELNTFRGNLCCATQDVSGCESIICSKCILNAADSDFEELLMEVLQP